VTVEWVNQFRVIDVGDALAVAHICTLRSWLYVCATTCEGVTVRTILINRTSALRSIRTYKGRQK
jgi:hypothetical protein